VRVVDCMPVRSDRRDGGRPDVFRRVEGLSGRVHVRSEVTIRFGYGDTVPWFREVGRRTTAFAGPDALTLDGDVAHVRPGSHGNGGGDGGGDVVADFTLGAGDTAEFRITWSTPRDQPPAQVDVGQGIAATEQWWREWARRCRYDGPYREAVMRSLITLKAMSYGPSGGIVAAPTTSLPEKLGGVRNWDYRFCWIRDATFTLLALLGAGYEAEAVAWREWLLRAVAGAPSRCS
jgi:GH15 family glucan-1,4-alpha-glucosidase